ncbi:thermonuclease family protein [Xanthobacter sp. V13C-7B]|uniref:thermonuclease family protein n=1 Tax=Xanthobacter variabilis TaxID=3119932 RepID=UPI00372800EA
MIEAAGGAVTATLGGRTITFSRAQTDRHGRLVGEAVMTDGPDAGADIATILVAAGGAFTDAQGPCAAALLSAEAQAREARRGLWAEPGAIASATDEAEMSRRLGLYTVTEGRILSVGVRRERTYLNFGESWRRDFTLMVPTRDFAIILGQGQDPVILRGARIRARGVVREQGGPAIMIRSQADIERLSDRTGSED